MVCLPDDKQEMRTSFHHPSACNHFIAHFIMHFLRMSVFPETICNGKYKNSPSV